MMKELKENSKQQRIWLESPTTTATTNSKTEEEEKEDSSRLSIYGEALLISCIFLTLYFAWHVFAMGSGGVLYHGY